MIICDVTYCVNNKDGVCRLESICLNINRRCTKYISREAKEQFPDLAPLQTTPIIYHCED